MALVGASGVGKSSLLNALTGDDLMRVRALRGDGKGRHTTVTRELHRVAGGGARHRQPGPALGRARATPRASSWRSPTSSSSPPDCRFADCGHTAEPGCAVLAAVERGDLAPSGSRTGASWSPRAAGRSSAATRGCGPSSAVRLRAQARMLRRTLRNRP